VKILVTGGAGFIGSHFVCNALSKGYEVINVDKLTYAGDLGNLEQYREHPTHYFYKEDICNRSNIEDIIFKHKPDVLVHMAAESHVDRSIDCADEFIRTNINGTHVLLGIALKYYRQHQGEFRFIHVSTDEVFGSLGTVGQFDEQSPYRPNSPYAASKAASDFLVRSYWHTYGFPAIIVNSSNNYGPKQYPEKLIPKTILNALEGKPIPIYGDGKQIRDWLFVGDHVEAIFAIIARGIVGESYCVGANNEMSNLELVLHICSILNNTKLFNVDYNSLLTHVADRPGHDFRYATNSSKLVSHTGWCPKTDFKDGLKTTILWYIEQFAKFKTDGNSRERIGLGA
jgi:dTDP-glucose 4,6-dehydratase